MKEPRFIEFEGALWFEAPTTDSRWKVWYRLDIARERLVFAELRIVPAGRTIPPDGMSAALLRSIPNGEHRRQLGEVAARDSHRLGDEHADLMDALGIPRELTLPRRQK